MKRLFLLIALFCPIWMGVCTVSAQQRATKVRVVIDNDYCGDPDGLFQLAHQLLCTTCDIRGIIGSRLPAGDMLHRGEDQPQLSCEKAREVIRLMGMEHRNIPLTTDADLIVREARLCTPEKPLFVLAGAGLQNVAAACLQDTTIQDRIIVIWIGGKEYNNNENQNQNENRNGLDFGFYAPPGHGSSEYNFSISPEGAMTVFNDLRVRLWQVPRDAYRQCLYSLDEVRERIRPCGKIGKYLYDELMKTILLNDRLGKPMGEVYALGDSPLVLLSALQTGYAQDPASSYYRLVPCPHLNADGTYSPNPQGRPIRVYTRLDVRLMLADFEAKMKR